MFYALNHFVVRLEADLSPGPGVRWCTKSVDGWLQAIREGNIRLFRDFTVQCPRTVLEQSGDTQDQVLSSKGLALVAGVASWELVDSHTAW